MSLTHADVAMQFDDAEQQRSAATFGMWIFLTTEFLFFGGMFVAYAVYRTQFPDAFVLGGQHVNLWAGGVMTTVLLTGSLLVAMSDHLIEHSEAGGASETDKLRSTIVRRLAITAALGVAFLGCEFYEYYTLIGERLFPGSHFDNSQFAHLDFAGGSAQLFFVLFFCMTGLHGLHMIIGISLVSGLAVAIRRSREPVRLRTAVKVIGLYWHFVDIVWLFLYPLFYLVR
ncbi:MAG: cytochrome c oxidase subunit 3 [Planctomycetota bacterium]